MRRAPAAEVLAEVPAELWSEARAARRRLLALDFDGTLASFTIDPAHARPRPRVRAALGRIVLAGRSDVAIVSGRPPEQLVAALGPLPIPVIGEHGWSELDADGKLHVQPLDPGIARLLADAARAAERWSPPARVERKRASVVVHSRGLEREDVATIERLAADLFRAALAHPRIELRRIDGGVELRVRGHDKGSAVARLIDAGGPETFAVVVGDDESDEDAFRVAAERGGWGVLVGPSRPTAARARLHLPESTSAFLEAWLLRVDVDAARAELDAARASL